MSQWAAMTGWASAIQQDIERATEKIYTTHKENVALLYKTDQQKKSFENAEKALKNDLELITKKLQAGIVYLFMVVILYTFVDTYFMLALLETKNTLHSWDSIYRMEFFRNLFVEFSNVNNCL